VWEYGELIIDGFSERVNRVWVDILAGLVGGVRDYPGDWGMCVQRSKNKKKLTQVISRNSTKQREGRERGEGLGKEGELIGTRQRPTKF